MEAPSLKLSMLQGPRKGETLEFRPGISIRIGRVLRGNNLSIKDSGISSNHLSINTESGKWILRDLDSSNGTFIDGNKIPPLTPFPLHDGATIDIGEVTSIHVTLLLPRPESTRVTRNSRKNTIVVDMPDVNLKEKVVEEPKKTRVTRNSKKEQNMVANSPPKNLDLECRVENVEPKKTRGRGRKRKLKEEPAQVAELDDTKIDEVEQNPDDDGVGMEETCDDGSEGQDCGVQQENLNANENWPNLEQMILAEWFDFLEVHLPKRITDETEEMIVSMREKAETLRVYIIQQKNDKGKMLL